VEGDKPLPKEDMMINTDLHWNQELAIKAGFFPNFNTLEFTTMGGALTIFIQQEECKNFVSVLKHELDRINKVAEDALAKEAS
jgi:hypothetical protein